LTLEHIGLCSEEIERLHIHIARIVRRAHKIYNYLLYPFSRITVMKPIYSLTIVVLIIK